jgi:hypothetical protein
MKRFVLFVAVPLVIALVTAVFGTALPIVGYEMTHGGSFEPHNVIWELVYGIGFSGAAWFCYFFNLDFALSRPVGLVGFVIWPLLVMTAVFIASRRILRSSRRSRLIWTAAFLLSLFVCVVGQRAENFLAGDCWLPLYWNFYASWY